ncbi:MAG: hypothetical protein KF788_18040 [Piscinibacter sp.]|nr:hypothetical protein [Piscinibacter sp.]
MTDDITRDRLAAEPFAFALVQWPALVGALAWDGPGWESAGRWAMVAWLALTVLAGYSGRRPAAFGNLLVLLLVVVGFAWWTGPGAVQLAWLPPLLVGLYAAQRARLRPATAAPPAQPAGRTTTV